MNKLINYILVLILSFICFNVSTKAITCSYTYERLEDYSNTDTSVNFTLNITSNNVTLNGKDVNEYNIDSTDKKSNTNKISVTNLSSISGNNSVYYPIFSGTNKTAIINESNGGTTCPNLKARREASSEGNYYYMILYSSNSLKSGLVSVSNNSNSSSSGASTICDSSKKSTSYKFSKDYCSVFFSSDKESCLKNSSNVKQVNLYMCAYSDGSYDIRDSSGTKIGSTFNQNSSTVWSGSIDGNNLTIRQSEWNEIKSAYPYSSTTTEGTGNITVSPVKSELSSKNVISINGVSDSTGEETTMTNDYSMNGDSQYSKLLSIIEANPSSNIGTCESYLGLASEEGTIASYLQTIFTVIKIASMVLFIVFTMLDFSKAIVNNKEDVMKVAATSTKKLIILVIILLLPTLIDIIGKIASQDNILCGIK